MFKFGNAYICIRNYSGEQVWGDDVQTGLNDDGRRRDWGLHAYEQVDLLFHFLVVVIQIQIRYFRCM